MALDQDQTGTEAPTPRRREDARKNGQIAHSADLASGVGLFLGAFLLWMMGRSMGGDLAVALRDGLSFASVTSWGPAETMISARWFAGRLTAIAAAPVALIGLAGLLVSVGQVGFHINFDALAPNWERLSPARGWSRILSLDGLARGLLVMLKSTAVLLSGFYLLKASLRQTGVTGRGTLEEAVAFGWCTSERIALIIAGAILLLGVADYAFQWFRNEQRLMMTREQLKEEQKDETGDPHVRARIRKLQREAAQLKMLQDVPQATVVLTNPTHLAVALKYDRQTMGAPRLVAKGAGAMAKRIVRIAQENGVPVIERKPIARALYRAVEVGREIPVELYQAVAEILAAIFRLKRGA